MLGEDREGNGATGGLEGRAVGFKEGKIGRREMALGG